MAETECRETSVAISSTQPTFWDLVSSSTNNPWQQQTIPNYSNTCNNNNVRCDDHDQDVSNSSASFTNTSNHSSLSVDSSRRLVDHRSASSNDDLMNGEQVSDNHLWNQVLLSSVNGHHGLRNNDHVDIGENFLDSLSAKSLSSSSHLHSLYEPACDYLKKLDSTSTAWEFPNSGAASLNLNSFDKQLNGGGFIDDNHMIENDRLTKLSHLVSTWSIAPPDPQLMDHDDDHHHYSQPGLFEAHAHGLRATSFSKNSGISDYHQICLDNAMAADDHYPHQNGKSYLYGDGILPVDSRNIADVLSFTSRLGNYNKPLIDHTAHAPKPNGFKPSTTVSNHLPKKQGIQTSSSSRTSSGRGQGIPNEGKKKRTDDNTSSSETVAKKAKQETSTVSSSVKMQAPKVKIGDKITALQQIVSPFGKTDTASVLYEAIQFIKFLQDQVHVLLSNPYLKTNNSHKDPWATSDVRKDHSKGDGKLSDLKSKGLCLVPVSCTPQVYRENSGSDYWAPTYRGCLYR